MALGTLRSDEVDKDYFNQPDWTSPVTIEQSFERDPAFSPRTTES